MALESVNNMHLVTIQEKDARIKQLMEGEDESVIKKSLVAGGAMKAGAKGVGTSNTVDQD